MNIDQLGYIAQAVDNCPSKDSAQLKIKGEVLKILAKKIDKKLNKKEGVDQNDSTEK